jgi:hypothetical protein
MPKGVTIPESLRKTVIRMSDVFNPTEIRAFTNVSERQQRRIGKLWRTTGAVVVSKDNSRPRGRPRHLSAEEVAVCFYSCSLVNFTIHTAYFLVQFIHGTVNETCDIYLDELRDSLGAICGTRLSVHSIWRTLKRGGYRMKKVRVFEILSDVIVDFWPYSSLVMLLNVAHESEHAMYSKLRRDMSPSNWFLLMKVLQIEGRLIEDMLGPLEGDVLFGRHSLFVDAGKSPSQ